MARATCRLGPHTASAVYKLEEWMRLRLIQNVDKKTLRNMMASMNPLKREAINFRDITSHAKKEYFIQYFVDGCSARGLHFHDQYLFHIPEGLFRDNGI
ncbi:hypothetical protein E2C01_061836 [Portunus trituberculatus]|uniref:Uncharacterized protein n=1 Tax=Portunus trituberculatus TaxID=210409 RepID=A0A5B7HFI5_PORTR|nr:hypothetical protein [Portunus trituberculatus]